MSTRTASSGIIQSPGATGHFRLTGEAIGTVHGFLNNVRVTFLRYPYELLFPPIALSRISIADPRDIGLMKITAISGRGSKKDFIDLRFISQQVSAEAPAKEVYAAWLWSCSRFRRER